MSPAWKWYLPGYLLALPGTLIGLLLCAYYRPQSIRMRSGCIEIVAGKQLIGGPWVAAQTYGNVIWFRDIRSSNRAALAMHERVHVWQSMVLSWPLFVIAYGLHYFYNLIIYKNWKIAYYHVWAERQAYLAAEFNKGLWGNE